MGRVEAWPFHSQEPAVPQMRPGSQCATPPWRGRLNDGSWMRQGGDMGQAAARLFHPQEPVVPQAQLDSLRTTPPWRRTLNDGSWIRNSDNHADDLPTIPWEQLSPPKLWDNPVCGEDRRIMASCTAAPKVCISQTHRAQKRHEPCVTPEDCKRSHGLELPLVKHGQMAILPTISLKPRDQYRLEACLPLTPDAYCPAIGSKNWRIQWAKQLGKATVGAALVASALTKRTAKAATSAAKAVLVSARGAAVAVPPPAMTSREILRILKGRLAAAEKEARSNRRWGQSTREYVNVESLQGDQGLVLAALRCTKAHLVCVGDTKNVMINGLARDAHLASSMSDGLKSNRSFVLQAVNKNGGVLEHVASHLRADREVVLAAVQQDGSALCFAHPSFRSDREVVLAAVQSHGEMLAFASKQLKSDWEVVLSAVRNCGHAFEHADHSLRMDRGFVLQAVRCDAHALRYAHTALHHDQEVVIAAVSASHGAFEVAEDALRSDKQLCVSATKAKLRKYCRPESHHTACFAAFTPACMQVARSSKRSS
mmetsp:Transcript_112771/g.224301  ORF Transcript_112771/g.224301 Transcript_112771/m.224301 type:complete len:539 (-) Transcript_112771:60-1676(-)